MVSWTIVHICHGCQRSVQEQFCDNLRDNGFREDLDLEGIKLAYIDAFTAHERRIYQSMCAHHVVYVYCKVW